MKRNALAVLSLLSHQHIPDMLLQKTGHFGRVKASFGVIVLVSVCRGRSVKGSNRGFLYTRQLVAFLFKAFLWASIHPF